MVKKEIQIINMDSRLCLEKPKIRPYVSRMQRLIADIIDGADTDVFIKATTTEKMGFIGREEGIAAYATVLLEKR